MNDISYGYGSFPSHSDGELLKLLGTYVRHHRVLQNKTQDQLSKDAGISRSTLSLLERGETVTLLTFIQVLRVLDVLYVLNNFNVEKQLSPMMLAEMAQKVRKRARPKKSDSESENDEWSW